MAEDNTGVNQPGVLGAAERVGTAMIAGLPPSFLGLLLINTVFLLAIVWFLNSRMDATTVVVAKIVDGCLAIRRNDPHSEGQMFNPIPERLARE